MGTTCNECGAAFQRSPFPRCPYCGNEVITSETDIGSEGPKDNYNILGHILKDLCERVYSGPYSVELHDTEIQKTMERLILIIMGDGNCAQARLMNQRAVDLLRIYNHQWN